MGTCCPVRRRRKTRERSPVSRHPPPGGRWASLQDAFGIPRSSARPFTGVTPQADGHAAPGGQGVSEDWTPDPRAPTHAAPRWPASVHITQDRAESLLHLRVFITLQGHDPHAARRAGRRRQRATAGSWDTSWEVGAPRAGPWGRAWGREPDVAEAAAHPPLGLPPGARPHVLGARLLPAAGGWHSLAWPSAMGTTRPLLLGDEVGETCRSPATAVTPEKSLATA